MAETPIAKELSTSQNRNKVKSEFTGKSSHKHVEINKTGGAYQPLH